eukprot:s832_g11.t1
MQAGTALFTGSRDCSVMLWDLETGRPFYCRLAADSRAMGHAGWGGDTLKAKSALSSSALLALVDSGQEVIRCNFTALAADVAASLGQRLVERGTVRSLDLCYCELGALGVEALAASIARPSGLRQLSLGANAMTARGACAAASLATGLKRLDLEINQLGDEGCKFVSQKVLLRVSTTLQHLDLGMNSIGREGALALAEALGANTALTRLDLGYNRIGSEGAEVMSAQEAESATLQGTRPLLNGQGHQPRRQVSQSSYGAVEGGEAVDAAHLQTADTVVVTNDVLRDATPEAPDQELASGHPQQGVEDSARPDPSRGLVNLPDGLLQQAIGNSAEFLNLVRALQQSMMSGSGNHTNAEAPPEDAGGNGTFLSFESLKGKVSEAEAVILREDPFLLPSRWRSGPGWNKGLLCFMVPIKGRNRFVLFLGRKLLLFCRVARFRRKFEDN